MRDSVTLLSPAKVNLSLAVHARRPDGYHAITTVFERIDLCDELTLVRCEASRGISLHCDHPDLPVDDTNLAVRAAKQVFALRDVKAGLRIGLSKRIPVAGGLGGGSSNAATVLQGIDRLFGLGLGREEMVSLGRGLGADVAFFLYDTPWALGEERGDAIRPLAVDRELWHVLVVPPVMKPSTGAIYASLPPGLTQPIQNASLWHLLLEALESGNLDNINIHNDLENSRLIRQQPMISQAKQLLRDEGALWVTMSGAGPSVVGIVTSPDEAEPVAHRVRERTGWPVFVAKTY